MKLLRFLFPDFGEEIRNAVRREMRREMQASLVTHSAARQALDLYEMKLEALDTRMAKRIMALEAKVDELELREELQPARQQVA
jgi:hypothetical protein